MLNSINPVSKFQAEFFYFFKYFNPLMSINNMDTKLTFVTISLNKHSHNTRLLNFNFNLTLQLHCVSKKTFPTFLAVTRESKVGFS